MNLGSFAETYGPWALVTGASSGIGEEFARQLAARGLSLVLVARRVDRLSALRDELTQRHGVAVDLLAQDLCAPDAAAAVARACEPRDVGLVVNNAGVGLKGLFHELPADEQLRMVQLNCALPLALTHALLPRLLARGRGGVIFTSSTAAFQATPLTSAYAATKGFGLQLAEGLWYELRPRGIDVLALCPGATDTDGPRRTGVDNTRVPFGPMTVAPVVRAALEGLGRAPVVVPGVVNKLGAFGVRLLPRSVSTRLAGRMIARVTARPTGR